MLHLVKAPPSPPKIPPRSTALHLSNHTTNHPCGHCGMLHRLHDHTHQIRHLPCDNFVLHPYAGTSQPLQRCHHQLLKSTATKLFLLTQNYPCGMLHVQRVWGHQLLTLQLTSCTPDPYTCLMRPCKGTYRPPDTLISTPRHPVRPAEPAQ